MSIRFQCPECGEKLALSEHLAGLHSHCPHCRSPIVVPQPGHAPREQVTAPARPPAPPLPAPPPPVSNKLPAPAPPVPEKRPPVAPPPAPSGTPRPRDADPSRGFFPPDRDGPKPLAASGEGWGPVRAGLTVLEVGLGLIAAGFGILALLILGLCIADPGTVRLGGGIPSPAALPALGGGLIVLVLLLLGALTLLAGQGICGAVPGRTGLRGLVLTALVCSLAGQTLGLVYGALDAAREPSASAQQQQQTEGTHDPLGRSLVPGAEGVLLFVSAGVLTVVGHFLLAGFLRGVGNYFEDPTLAAQADDYIRHLATFLAIVAGLYGLTCVPAMRPVALALPLVLVIYGVILFVKLFNLLAATRSTVAEAIAQG